MPTDNLTAIDPAAVRTGQLLLAGERERLFTYKCEACFKSATHVRPHTLIEGARRSTYWCGEHDYGKR